MYHLNEALKQLIETKYSLKKPLKFKCYFLTHAICGKWYLLPYDTLAPQLQIGGRP